MGGGSHATCWQLPQVLMLAGLHAGSWQASMLLAGYQAAGRLPYWQAAMLAQILQHHVACVQLRCCDIVRLTAASLVLCSICFACTRGPRPTASNQQSLGSDEQIG